MRKISTATLATISITALLVAFVFLATFYLEQYPPIWVSVICAGVVTGLLVLLFRGSRIGVAVLLFWAVWTLPFVHVPPYLWFDFSSQPERLWGLAVNPYMVDHDVIQLLAFLGAVGSLGYFFGAVTSGLLAGEQKVSPGTQPSVRRRPGMVWPFWFVWLFAGLAFSVLSSPQETIFETAYTESTTMLQEANFSSAWMLSYVLLTFVYVDALLDKDGLQRSLKLWVFAGTLLLIVVWYQLLRGDRESLPWLLGIALAAYYWSRPSLTTSNPRLPWLKLLVLLLVLLCIAMVTGALRSQLFGVSAGQVADVIQNASDANMIGFGNIFYGTWSGVLLSPLSVAGDYHYGLMEPQYGADYLNLALSIMPGFVADWFGYVRPIDGMSGPAWEMRYGIGGTHALVLPFRNFSMPGVFLVTTFWSFLVCRAELNTCRNPTITGLSLLVVLVMAAPHWLWYGEKNIINALIMWMIASGLYKLCKAIQKTNIGWRVSQEVY